MKTRKSIIVTAIMKFIGLIAVVIIASIILFSCAAGKKTVKNNTVAESKSGLPDQETPFVIAEEMPMFNGGDIALLSYLAKNTRYPETAKTNKIQGKVIVRFCVTSEGGVDRISVLKSVSPELDEEAIRVVGTLPSFIPGRQGGKPVPVWYMVPINFALDRSVSDSTTNSSLKMPGKLPE
jgi:TonB family protein